MYTISILKREKVYPARPSVFSEVTVANANLIISSGVDVTKKVVVGFQHGQQKTQCKQWHQR